MHKENILDYIKSKQSELKHLRFRDILLARAVSGIHRHRTKKQMKYIPLFSITPIHCIDRESAVNKVRERAGILLKHKHELIKIKRLQKKTLLQYLPSVSGIKVIRDIDGQYISFEGNGRVEAFKKVFDEKDDIRLQVEEYILDDYKKVLKRVNRVRRRNFPGKYQ